MAAKAVSSVLRGSRLHLAHFRGAVRGCSCGTATGNLTGRRLFGGDSRDSCGSPHEDEEVDARLRRALADAASRVAAVENAVAGAAAGRDGVSDEVGNKAGAPEGVRTAGEKLVIQFTCTSDQCEEARAADEAARRVTKVISKKSYETGVVLVRCPCENLHMIADNLGWFGEEKNVVELMQKRGQSVATMVDEGTLDIQ